jgi:serine/threonine-protein kinase
MSDPNEKAEGQEPKAGEDAEPVSPESAVRMLREMGQQDGAFKDTLVNEAPPLIGRALGQYKIVSKIGQGGMGAVFKARDSALSRDVALKVLWTGPLEDPRVAERFVREARCLARLSHPHLLHVYNVGSEGDLKYFAMELLDGDTLAAALKRGPLKIPEAVAVIGQMLAALDYVHRQGITHRDIKSGNIMLCGSRAVLMDFGLAKEEHMSGLTSEGVVLGTPEYMTPEQADGRACGAPTDIYSLGVVFFEALTGQVPFTGRSALSIIRQHLDEPPPSLAKRLPGVDLRLDQIIQRALAKEPSERFPDCAAMAEALSRVHQTPELLQLAATRTAGDTMVAAKRDFVQPTVPLAEEQAARPVSRRSWLWLVAGFLVVLVLGVGIGALRALRRKPVPAKGQVVRVESGPNRGQTLRWEFVSKGSDPKSWLHRVEELKPDGSWSKPRAMTHDEFMEAYPKLGLGRTEGTGTP